jgi:predicted nucleic acid-binding protein
MILLLDNTVLSNFALVDRINLLPKALGSQISTTPQVIDEFQTGTAKGILPAISWDWLEIIELSQEEEALFQRYMKRVNSGDASCLAVAAQRNGRFLTDDRDARKLAAQSKIPVSGTLGILQRLVQINTLTQTEADQLLNEMILKGYRSPIAKLGDL